MIFLNWFGSLFFNQKNDKTNSELTQLNHLIQPQVDQMDYKNESKILQLTSTIWNKTTKLAHNAYQSIAMVDYCHYANQLYCFSASTINLISAGLFTTYHKIEQVNSIYQQVKCSSVNPNYNLTTGNRRATEDDNEFSRELDLLCSICYEREKNRVIFPCGHTFCDVCIRNLTECPNCRSQINGQMKFYL